MRYSIGGQNDPPPPLDSALPLHRENQLRAAVQGLSRRHALPVVRSAWAARQVGRPEAVARPALLLRRLFVESARIASPRGIRRLQIQPGKLE